ncbi:MAG: DUF1254 domain-containing protein [Rhabdaerophilum sp.]
MMILLHLLIAGVIAGLMHIAGLFALPRFAHEDAFSVFSRQASGDSITLIAEENLRQMPFVDPHVAIGICKFDLTVGPFRVRTGLSDTFLAVVFAREQHGILASVSDRAATSGALDVVLATSAQLERIALLDDGNEAIEEVRVPSTQTRGIAIIKVLVDRPSSRPVAEAVIRAVQCGSEALPG